MASFDGAILEPADRDYMLGRHDKLPHSSAVRSRFFVAAFRASIQGGGEGGGEGEGEEAEIPSGMTGRQALPPHELLQLLRFRSSVSHPLRPAF